MEYGGSFHTGVNLRLAAERESSFFLTDAERWELNASARWEKVGVITSESGGGAFAGVELMIIISALLRFSLKLPLALFSIIFLFYFYNSNSDSPTSSTYSTSNTQRIRSKAIPL